MTNSISDCIVLEFKGRAISKDNEKLISKYPSKRTGRPFVYTSTKYKIYEKDLKRQAQAQLSKGWKPLKGNVWVSLFFYFKSKVHTDICNLPKSICDAMTGILWENDRQVWLALVRPYYDKNKQEGFSMMVVKVNNGDAKG